MLPEENRLRLKKDHDTVYKKGLRYKSPFFLLICLKKTDSSLSTRFSFVISKKTEKTAVMRNRVRRQMRELVRKNLKFINSGFDCIMIANREFVGKKTKSLIPEFERILKKAGIINNVASM